MSEVTIKKAAEQRRVPVHEIDTFTGWQVLRYPKFPLFFDVPTKYLASKARWCTHKSGDRSVVWPLGTTSHSQQCQVRWFECTPIVVARVRYFRTVNDLLADI